MSLGRSIVLIALASLACGASSGCTGCGASDAETRDAAPVTIGIRFHGGAAPAGVSAQAGSLAAPLALAGAAPLASLATVAPAVAPARYDQVARILVDISYADSGQPFYLDLELTRHAADDWRGNVPLLPRDVQLRFAARALDASGTVAFSGETLATLAIDNQRVQIPLAPAQDGGTYQLPRMYRIVYPSELYAGQEEPVIFTIEGNAGAAIAYEITPAGSATPSPAFSPAAGTVTLTNTVADVMALYTPPAVTVETSFDYQVTITAADAQSAVAITTSFRAVVKPRPPGGAIVTGTAPSVLWNPVILSMTANGSETPGEVALAAAVSDDGGAAGLSYQWSYAPEPGTPAATFADSGQGNPGRFTGYTVAHRGTLTLAVTDADGGTTTLHYQLRAGQFTDAIDHTSASHVRQLAAGAAHTCVVTGAGRVRCWGDNQYGQLGYGHTTDLGDAPGRLPYMAGDVPLAEADPVTQLAAGRHHTCALLQSGLVTCWGRNQYGQLGYGRTDSLGDDEAVTAFGYVLLGGLARRIAAGGDHTCAILQSGALQCWGATITASSGGATPRRSGTTRACTARAP